MASTDARPVPQKNVAFRVTFCILDADGDLVTGATGLDSEISKDGGTAVDCTNEATEIATATGLYFLDLTAAEMNADTVAIIVKTTSAGAKTTPIILYPEEAGDIRANVTQWLSATAPAAPATQTSVDGVNNLVADVQARLPATLVGGRINSSVGAVAADVISDASVSPDMDSYGAKMWVTKQSTISDEYGVTFYKNGQPIESGITSPLIDYVKKLSDGSILVNDATLLHQTNGDYYYGETTNKLAAGNAYMMRVTATIDGSSRIFKQQVSRDSA